MLLVQRKDVIDSVHLYLITLNSILHRYPTILATPEDWEIEMYELQDKIAARKREV